MSTLTIRLPDEQHDRLKALAGFDTETRFKLRASHGDRKQGLEIPAALDRLHSKG